MVYLECCSTHSILYLSRMMMKLICFLLALLGCAFSNPISTLQRDVDVSEGESVTLSCTYTGGSGSELYWYQQHLGSKPEYILFIMESGFNRTADTPLPGVTVHIDKELKRVDMKISPVKLSHSALYYCALRPTVTGN